MIFENFVKAINYLKAAYPNIKVDLEDSYTLNVWYDILKDFNYEQFKETISYYVKHNQFAPQSPASLIECEKERILKNTDIADKFDKLISRIRDNNYNLALTVERYSKGGQVAISKTVKELQHDFERWFEDASQLPFLKSKFAKTYANNIDIENDNLKIGYDSQKKIGG